MSDTLDDDDGALDGPKPPAQRGAIDDEDVRAVLTQRTRERDQLLADLEKERRRASAAEANSHNSAAARYDAEEARLASQMDAREAALKGKEREAADAWAEGRFEDAAKVQREMARLEAQAMRDTEHLAWVKSEKTKATAAPRSNEIDLSTYSRKQRAWIKDHPEFMDQNQEGARLRSLTFAGHQIAVANEVPVDSDEYFDIIDRTVENGGQVSMREKPQGRTAADILAQDDDDDEAPPPRKREAPAVAPVQRRQPSQERGNQPVRLSPEEREAADITMPDIPASPWKDANGVVQPGRYQRFKTHQEAAKRRGQLN